MLTLRDRRNSSAEDAIRNSLSIVIPCFNEQDGLVQLKEQLDPVVAQLAERREVELVFVDDGSADRTVEHIRQLWPAGTIVRHERNLGPGAALRDGALAAHGELIVFIDSDCTYRPAEIPALLAEMEPGIDIVTASPYHHDGGVVGVKPYRFLLSRMCSLLYQAITGTSIATYTSFFRVYRREVLESAPRWSDGFVALAELLILPAMAGRVVREYPTVLFARQFNFSKIRVARTIRTHLRFMAWLVAMRVLRRVPARPRPDDPRPAPLP